MPASGDNLQALPEGTQLLWYRIERVLGQGGFGITYLAHDSNLDSQVAIKEYLPGALAVRGSDLTVLPSSVAVASDFAWGLERFLDEGKTLAKFDHPGIVRVLSVFEQNGTAYLVMRYESGSPLNAVLERDGSLSGTRLRAILVNIVDGLEQVHAAGFIHRDIKPANIFIRSDDSAVLLDFGAARLALGAHSQSLTAIVSPGYAPFEQYFSDSTGQGPWTDIYALGATAYRAIGGVAPMPAVDRSKTLLAGSADSLVDVRALAADGYDGALLTAVTAAMYFHAEQRPQTLQQWRAMLNGEIELPVAARPPSVVDPNAATELASIEVSNANTGHDDPVAPDATNSVAISLPWFRNPRYVLVSFAVVALLIMLTILQRRSDDRAEQARHEAAVSHHDKITTLAASPAASPHVEETATPLVGDETEAAKNPAAGTIVVSPPETANNTETVIAIASPLAQTALSTPPTIELAADQIALLLRHANADSAAGRTTMPVGNNALQKYRDVLALEPENEAALDGLAGMVREQLRSGPRGCRAR